MNFSKIEVDRRVGGWSEACFAFRKFSNNYRYQFRRTPAKNSFNVPKISLILGDTRWTCRLIGYWKNRHTLSFCVSWVNLCLTRTRWSGLGIVVWFSLFRTTGRSRGSFGVLRPSRYCYAYRHALPLMVVLAAPETNKTALIWMWVNEMKNLNLNCEFQLTFQGKTQTTLPIDQMRGNWHCWR